MLETESKELPRAECTEPRGLMGVPAQCFYTGPILGCTVTQGHCCHLVGKDQEYLTFCHKQVPYKEQLYSKY